MNYAQNVWPPSGTELAVVLVLGLWLATFVPHTLFLGPQAFLRGRDPDMIPERTRAYAHFYHRMVGAFMFGATAWLGIRLRDGTADGFGFGWGHIDRSALFIILFTGAALLVVNALSRRPGFNDTHPQVRVRRWTGRLISNNRTTWLVYLASYEAFVRGFALLTLAQELGPAAALAITLTLDLAAYLRRPPMETLVALPMSLALGLGALWTGSLLGPWLMHAFVIIAAETKARPSVEERQSA